MADWGADPVLPVHRSDQHRVFTAFWTAQMLCLPCWGDSKWAQATNCALLSWRASLEKIPTLALPTITIKKAPQKVSRTILVLQVLPCICVKIFLYQELSCAERGEWSFPRPRKNTCTIPLLVLRSKDNPRVRKRDLCFPACRGGPWGRSKPKLLLMKLHQEQQLAAREAPAQSAPLHGAAPGVKHYGWNARQEWSCSKYSAKHMLSPQPKLLAVSRCSSLVCPSCSTLNQTQALKEALNSLLFITSREEVCLTPRIATKEDHLPGPFLL